MSATFHTENRPRVSSKDSGSSIINFIDTKNLAFITTKKDNNYGTCPQTPVQ